ncbi:G-type lectin S-receptor-like serine/threonine-protein kinase [Apostasia shenzhenica]|uniref:non-specific serine/threonine protein kinase n=1 Tax=Apostasia shenzhenica TaxID=1088818 RepID=A0A2I0AA30_9ASPA|nr:G-type lectin S-receptor-like serine/threonine-protein kinase [Apostasia shenzhenica]
MMHSSLISKTQSEYLISTLKHINPLQYHSSTVFSQLPSTIFFLYLCLSFPAITYGSSATDSISFGTSITGNKTIVSKGGTFALGFFTPGKSQRSYIGIWYFKRPERAVVWVANREKPVSNSSLSELKITQDGNLAIFDESKTQVWSSDLKSKAFNSTSAVLLDTGNIELVNTSEPSVILWQSFDHPTDTWLPGARMGWNAETKQYMTLVSWKSLDDPAPGYYSYGLDPRGKDQLVQMWNGTEIYWSSGIWNGEYFNSVPEMTRNNVYNYTYFQKEKYLVYSLFRTDILTRLVADITGKGVQWAWVSNSPGWTAAWTQPKEQCQIFSFCGPFSVCIETGELPCSCLKGFEPASSLDWDSKIWNGGCVRKTRLQCGNNASAAVEKDKFFGMPNMELPSHPVSLAAENEEVCELGCLSNCSCTAYSYLGNACMIWKGDIRNLKPAISNSANDSGTVLFLRLAASELKSSDSKLSKKEKIGIALGSVAGFACISVIVFLLTRRFRRGKLIALFKKDKASSLIIFRYSTIQILTKNFTDKLGGGGFGSVYKGLLPDSTPIAVKKLEREGQGEKQFRAEVSTMGRIQHVNLVRLRGFCCEGDKRLLVYDYMPNGSLDHHLFCASSKNPLPWRERYQIAIGTARGLAYLHEQCRECIIHCDIKPENILIGEDFRPKIADFGMAKLMGREVSRVLTTMRGTVGYLAPEWISGLPITPKADVYGFGMVLFELMSGRRNLAQAAAHGDEEEEEEDQKSLSYFPVMAGKKLAEGDVASLLDERLEGNADLQELDRACRVACCTLIDVDYAHCEYSLFLNRPLAELRPPDKHLAPRRQAWVENQHLVGWKNNEDPSPGLFYLEIDPNEKLQYIILWNGTKSYWSSGPWNGEIFSGVPEMISAYEYNFDFEFINNATKAYFTYTVNSNDVISRNIMDVSGQLKQLTWVPASQKNMITQATATQLW